MPILYISGCWLLGTYIGAKITIPFFIIFLSLLPLCLLPLLSHYKKTLITISFCLLAFFGANLRFEQSLPAVNENTLQFYNERGAVEITGTVSNDPEIKDVTQSFQFSASEIKVDNQSKQVSGTALIRVSKYPGYSYGDVIRVTGELSTPPKLDDFDYKGYLAQQGIYSIVYYPRIGVLDRGKGSTVLQAIYFLRNRLSDVISKTLPEPQGALAQGVVLGIRSDIPSYLNEAFVRTGTVHLLAISGLNLSIVLGMILSLGLWLFGKRYSLYIWLAFLVIWFYTLFTGMHPPIVRGAIMGSLFLLAEYFGRQRSAIVAITLAAALMVGIRPQLLWDAAFQLSFSSMAGLIFLSPPLQKWMKGKMTASVRCNNTVRPAANTIIDSFAVTLSAIIATLPLIAYYFGITSLVGLPATLLLLPAQPGIIVVTILAGVLGLIFLPLAQVLAWVSWLFLTYFIVIVQAFNALPLSSVAVSAVSLWQVWLYYGVFISVFWCLSSREQLKESFSRIVANCQQIAGNTTDFLSRLPKKWIVIPLLIVFTIIWAAVLLMPDDRLHVSFLNIGQGDAILIQWTQFPTMAAEYNPQFGCQHPQPRP